MKYKSYILILLLLLPFSISADTISQKLSGRILLQVEAHGEAWYVNPTDQKRYFLNRPSDAFSIMREFGMGVTNSDLEKIEIGLLNNCTDLDTDEDGYSDIEEIQNGYNPYGDGRLNIDPYFASRYAGQIFLQVEKNGEAWYINPIDSKRYYLGRPTDAFNLMRELGLGISNNDLSLLNIGKVVISEPKPDPEPQPILDSEDVKADKVMKSLGKAVIDNDIEKTLLMFTDEMQKSIDYSMKHLSAESRFILGNILASSKYSHNEGGKRVYTNKVSFQSDLIQLNFYLINVGSDWKLENL